MATINQSENILGVYTAHLKAFGDDRGRFMETFRKEWFPQRSWKIIQTNRSDSMGNVVRGLHYHFKQVDYWYVVSGMIRAVLVDIRPDSPTFRQVETIDIGDANPLGLFIPVGVAHGFATLTYRVTLTYIVDNYYDSQDEFGIAWNDKSLAIDWGVANPIVSDRDLRNPNLDDIPVDSLPSLALSISRDYTEGDYVLGKKDSY
ncbi:MAG: dTDP-4-dehydrorhamnose 3,5-epimerase [Ardenticatenaceae bacterium]|nr:dTDP-4-dehydrorhamnose 3,5-epimerase [Ardenticatenaceae bacterium]